VRTELYSQVAKKVLKDSLHMKKGETLTVETWNNGLPFAREVVKQARRIGCIPITLLEDEAAFLDGVRNASKESVGLMGLERVTTDRVPLIPISALMYWRASERRRLARLRLETAVEAGGVDDTGANQRVADESP